MFIDMFLMRAIYLSIVSAMADGWWLSSWSLKSLPLKFALCCACMRAYVTVLVY